MRTINLRQMISVALLSATLAVGLTGACAWGYRQWPTAQAAGGETAVEKATPAASRRLPIVPDAVAAGDERNNIEVYRAAAPGVVFITTSAAPSRKPMFEEDDDREGAGSGVLIDDQGHILTNEHVVAGAQRVTVKLSGEQTYSARVVGTDPDTDLAVLKIDAPCEQLAAIPMGNSEQLVVGQKVLAIGNPFGLDRTLTTGVISGLQRPIQTRNRRMIEGAIQTDASINPGNSGGPLLDSQGRLIGINTMIYSPSGGSVGVGFAIPVNIAKRIVPQLMSAGRVNRPRLGIGVRAISELRGQVRLPVAEGLVVMQVAPGSPAAAAGLRGLQQDDYGQVLLGDIIVAVDGQAVKEQEDLMRAVEQHQIGDEVEVEVLRGRQNVTLTMRLSEMKSSPRSKR
jgi:S1-C subfamily serine protease